MKRRLPGYLLALFVPSAALVLGAAVVVHRAQVAKQLEVIEVRESLDTQRGARELRVFIADRARDVHFLSNLPSMHTAVDDDSDESRAALEGMFVAAMEAKTDIDRIRWIDEQGHERVRVSAGAAGPVIVPPSQLQDKGERYFVRDIAALDHAQIYVSPMDLSVDRGVVERPFKPVVRMGTPVFDATGTRRGMLVINYRTTSVIASFDANTRGMFGHTMLLDGAGQWLHVQQGTDQWAFMFGRTERFATEQPAVWNTVVDRPNGQFRDEGGIWTFDTVDPLVAAAGAAGTPPIAGPVPPAARHWKVVSFVPDAEIAAMLLPLRLGVVAVTTVLLLFGFAASYVLARAWVRREEAALEQAQQEARQMEAGLRLVLKSNPNAMMVIDQAGVVYEANPQAERVFGYAPGEMRSLAVEDFVPQAVRGAHVRYREGYAERAHARPMGHGVDLRARRKDGSEFPVEISLAPLTLGGASYVVVTLVDISARKLAEAQVRELNATLERRVEQRTEELQRAESNLRLILESSANGLFGVDLSGRITFVNPAACRMLGVAASELIGRDAASLGANGAPGRGLQAHLERTLREGRDAAVDDEAYLRGSGDEIPVHYSTHPMVRGGRIIGAVVSFIDATERRALDRAREAALSEAERLAQARSDFLANMSHEIRTPLNGVLGLAQVAFREETSDGATRETFGRILESGRTLLGVVDNVLDFSRIEAGKVQVEQIVTELGPLLDEVLASILPVAKAKGVDVGVERTARAPERCVTDPMRVKQVLLNLLSNAVKFTERGEVVLVVDQVDGQLKFVVRDTGIGMSAEQLARIFSAFEQADTSTTRRFGGTGLGLAICKRITDLMGGQITASSVVGVGSEFVVLLPFVAPTADAIDPAIAHDATLCGTNRIARLAGLRLLLAEDNEVNRMVVLAMLRKHGPQVVSVADGREAVEQVRAHGPDAFDLVLMDIQMPVMDGYEATRLIHGIDPGLPVVGQTAHVLHEAIENCRAAGMVAHLPKPIDRRELIATIMRHARLRTQDADANAILST
ncbi:MAG TPA: PAS domain S-box protein [Steroidobacteraceae bacterium]|nr:PAS domain S-box protein [Steroidobacteraceae bacterium]